MAVGASAASLLLYLGAAVLRVWWPMPLDELELAVVAHVERVVAGHSLYGAPEVGFVPLAYPPVLYYVAASLWPLTGGGFVPVRLVSLLASIGSISVVSFMARYETGSWRVGLVAAGLESAVIATIGWFALARVDALMLFLVLLALVVLRTSRSAAAAACAGVLCGLAALTKQSAVFIWAFVSVWQLATSRRRGTGWVAGFLATVIVLGGAWEWQSGGWFSYYTVRVAANQRVGNALWALRSVKDVLTLMPFGVMAACALLWRSVRSRLSIDTDFAGLLMWATTGALVACVSSRLTHGSLGNVLLPVCTCLVILLTVTIAGVLRVAGQQSIDVIARLAAVVCVAQLAILADTPSRLLTESARGVYSTWVLTASVDQQGRRVVRRWPHWSAAEPSRYAASEAVGDLLAGGTASVAQPFAATMLRAFCQPQRSVDVDENLLLRSDIHIFAGQSPSCAVVDAQ